MSLSPRHLLSSAPSVGLTCPLGAADGSLGVVLPLGILAAPRHSHPFAEEDLLVFLNSLVGRTSSFRKEGGTGTN